jgi:hypothetical protein
MFDKTMQAALAADGEKLRAMTGEEHGPWQTIDDALVFFPSRASWRIEVLNADGTHHSYVPRFGNGDISAERALACLNETLDHARFSVRVVYT